MVILFKQIALGILKCKNKLGQKYIMFFQVFCTQVFLTVICSDNQMAVGNVCDVTVFQ